MTVNEVFKELPEEKNMVAMVSLLGLFERQRSRYTQETGKVLPGESWLAAQTGTHKKIMSISRSTTFQGMTLETHQ